MPGKLTSVHLPNGQTMKVYGTMDFELEILEWWGKVQAMVLELQADFDVVLGMEWHREWESVPNWKTLEFIIETNQGTKRLRRLPNAPDLQYLEDINHEFNLISVAELEQEIKNKHTEFILYFVQERKDDSNVQLNTRNNSSSECSEVEGLAGDDKELQVLLNEFRDVFKDELPDGLPPR